MYSFSKLIKNYQIYMQYGSFSLLALSSFNQFSFFQKNKYILFRCKTYIETLILKNIKNVRDTMSQQIMLSYLHQFFLFTNQVITLTFMCFCRFKQIKVVVFGIYNFQYSKSQQISINLPMKRTTLIIFVIIATAFGIGKTYDTVFQQTSYSQSSQDLQCLKYFGIKKIILATTYYDLRNVSNALKTVNTNLPQKSDVITYFEGNSTSASVVLGNFSSYVNSSLYDIVWLTPYMSASYKIDCDFIKTYVYYCGRLNLTCGFRFSDSQWSNIFDTNRTACPEAAVLPLYYDNRVGNTWKQMGGWNNYSYMETGNKQNFCYSSLYTIYGIEKNSKVETKVEIDE